MHWKKGLEREREVCREDGGGVGEASSLLEHGLQGDVFIPLKRFQNCEVAIRDVHSDTSKQPLRWVFGIPE